MPLNNASLEISYSATSAPEVLLELEHEMSETMLSRMGTALMSGPRISPSKNVNRLAD
jgi:hypothetical protein